MSGLIYDDYGECRVSDDEAAEFRALRDADTLHLLPVSALVASIRYLAEKLVGPK